MSDLLKIPGRFCWSVVNAAVINRRESRQLTNVSASLRKWHSGTVAVFIILGCFFPLFIAAAFCIWPPVTMVHEMSGINFACFNLLNHDFHLVETGHCSIVMLNYVASIIVAVFSSHQSLFNQIAVFSMTFYAWHGLLMLLLFTLAISDRHLKAVDSLGLLLIPLATACLERSTCFGLMINYHKGLELAYVAFGYLAMRWATGGASFGQLTPILLGALTGAFVGTKLSYAVIVAPMIFVMSVSWTVSDRQSVLASSMRFAAAALIALAAIFVVLLQFRLDHVHVFASSMASLYTGEWVSQQTPFLRFELCNSHDPTSYYFSLRMLAAAVAASIICTAAISFRIRSKRICLLVVFETIGLVCLGSLLEKRSSQGTMIDITSYLAFCAAVNSAIMARGCVRLRMLVPMLAVTSLAVGAASADPVGTIARLQHNSEGARAIHNIVEGHPSLPIVFYMAGLPQSLLIPSAEQIMLYELSSTSDPQNCFDLLCPRLRTRNPANGLLDEEHIAIIPEYIDVVPRTREIVEEWPAIWPAVHVLSEHPKLSNELRERGRLEFQYRFVEIQLRRHLLYYHAHPTLAHVYVVKRKQTQ